MKHILPKKIFIGYQDVSVSSHDLIDCQGVYLSDRSEIRIKDGMDDREILNTILHECFHGIFYTYGMKCIFDDDQKEEQICNTLGNAFTEIFIRNPDFIKWIKDKIQ